MALTTANWILKDTDRSKLNSKVKYPIFALSLNILFLLSVFIGFNTFKVRFGIAYIVAITIVQAMVNVGLLFPWGCMCLVECYSIISPCRYWNSNTLHANYH